MAYSAFAVANAFIQRAKEKRLKNLTPMKLQKLMYYAQAWHLRILQGDPLMDDNFCRWQFGPVVPAVYHEFKAYGYQAITKMAAARSPNPDDDGYRVRLIPQIPGEDEASWGLIDAIITRYGSIDAQVLSAMTHEEGSAWEWGLQGKAADGSVITHQEMLADKTLDARNA